MERQTDGQVHDRIRPVSRRAYKTVNYRVYVYTKNVLQCIMKTKIDIKSKVGTHWPARRPAPSFVGVHNT